MRWVGYPARSTTSAAASYSAPPVTPGRAAARAASSDSMTTSRSAATSSVTSPATNVRVMSAQQPLCSSRGHRSITIGRSAGSGPEPGSWPPSPDHADTTMMSGGAGAPAAAHAARIVARTVSAVSTSPA